MLTTLAISNYRSIRDLVMPLGALNLVTGANGSGKSNLYRALRPSAVLVERQSALVKARDEHGEWREVSRSVQPFDSMFTS